MSELAVDGWGGHGDRRGSAAGMHGSTLPFGRKEAIVRGWRLTMAHLPLAAGIVGIGWLISAAEAGLRRPSGGPGPGAGLLLLGLQVLHLLVTMGGIAIFLRLSDGGDARIGELFAPARLFFRYLAAQLLYGLIVAAGLLLLVVPGVVWAVRYAFVPFLVLDRELGPFAALRESKRLTMGHTRSLLGFGLLLVGVNLLGLLAFGVGLFLTVPTTAMAAAWAYRWLARAVDADAPAGDQATSSPA